MRCPYSERVLCEYIDTSGMTKTKECSECSHYSKNGVRETGALPDLDFALIQLRKIHFLKPFAWLWNHLFGILTNRWIMRDRKGKYRIWRAGDCKFEQVKSNLQFINWKQWRGFIFVKGDPEKSPAAFHLIYKWGVYLGWFEIRKFLSDKEMEKALKTYDKTSTHENFHPRSRN